MSKLKDAAEQKLSLSLILTKNLVSRMDDFIKSPVSEAKSRNNLMAIALTKFLNEEEPIIQELEKARIRIRKRMLSGKDE